MGEPLQPGDRVRLVVFLPRHSRLCVGDRGTVVKGPEYFGPSGRCLYFVAMDGDDPPRWVVLQEEEIEVIA